MDEVDLSDRSSDDKYITFKSSEFFQTLGYVTSEACLGGTRYEMPKALQAMQQVSLPDAVVIRRQDFFAAPALAGYAASIAIAIRLNDDPLIRSELQKVADYFERQAQLAAEEGWKFPTIE